VERIMRIAVLGAGVVGLTTATRLVEDGHEVTLIDRRSRPGLETSFGNGAQLSYAYVAPLASFATLMKVPGLLLSRQSPMRIRPTLDPAFLRWSLGFLAACSARAERETIAAQLALSALSRAETMRLAEEHALDFGLAENGKLVLFRKADGFAAARAASDTLRGFGIEQRVLTPAECLADEPALRLKPYELAGGILTPSEQVGDCARFCEQLGKKLAQRNSIRMLMETTLQAGVVKQGRLVAVATSAGEVEADLFVLALASGSVAFARGLDIRLPILPLKGYSITTRLSGGGGLRRSVTDSDGKVVFAPLQGPDGPMLRIAGIADLDGDDARPDPARLRTLIASAAKTMDVEQQGDLSAWTGMRPATPDSRPIIDWSPLPGLFLNTGHGALGWTLAAGSAALAAELIAGRPPSVDPAPFALRRGRPRAVSSGGGSSS